MTIPSNIKNFQKDRANDLEIVAEILQRNIPNINTGSLWKSISFLKSSKIPQLKDKTSDYSAWGYDIDELTFSFPIPRHVRPQGISELVLSLGIRIIANYDDWETPNDPLREFSFKVEIQGIGDKSKSYYNGFHIDRHPSPSTDIQEIHPLYHLQNLNPSRNKLFNYGDVLYLDAPRIIHYPMDFILGIGFLTANFAPEIYNRLLDDSRFFRLYKNYQQIFWKPYIHLLASYWKPFSKKEKNWKPNQICPYFLD